MKSLSDALFIWNIPNMAVRISLSQLEEIPFPAIAHFSDQYFVVLKNVKNNQVCYLHPQNAEITESTIDFEKKWSGNIIIVQPDERSGEANYELKLESQKLEWFFRTLALALLFVVALYPFFCLGKSDAVFYILKLAGAFICWLILHHQLEWSQITSTLCNWGKHMDCNHVLHSPASKLFSLSVSELGAIYFLGGVMSYWVGCLSGLSPSPVLSILNLIALLFTAYLIYYQLRLNKWCPLCLIVSLILVAEFTTAVNQFTLSISLQVGLITALGFSVIVASWLLLRSLFFRSAEMHSLQREVYRFKNDEKIFSALLHQSRAVQFNPRGSVTVGSKEPVVVVSLFSQPECSPCANAYQIADNLLLRAAGKIAIKVTLLVNPARKESDAWKIAFHFLALKTYKSPEIAFDALSQLYLQKKSLKAQEWIDRFPVNSEIDHTALNKILAEDFNKSNAAGITGTPAVYVNERRLPVHYDISDLLLHINHLLSRAEINEPFAQ
jgi:uncharacterized membrane protein